MSSDVRTKQENVYKKNFVRSLEAILREKQLIKSTTGTINLILHDLMLLTV